MKNFLKKFFKKHVSGIEDAKEKPLIEKTNNLNQPDMSTICKVIQDQADAHKAQKQGKDVPEYKIEFETITSAGRQNAEISNIRNPNVFWIDRQALCYWNKNEGQADWSESVTDLTFVETEYERFNSLIKSDWSEQRLSALSQSEIISCPLYSSIDAHERRDAYKKDIWTLRRFSFRQSDKSDGVIRQVTIGLDSNNLPAINETALPAILNKIDPTEISSYLSKFSQPGRMLGFFGPNHAADVIYVRKISGSTGKSIKDYEILLITRLGPLDVHKVVVDGVEVEKRIRAFPGGMVERSKLGHDSEETTAMKELSEECFGQKDEKEHPELQSEYLREKETMVADLKKMFHGGDARVRGDLVYTGLVPGDYRNTRNAFMVTSAFLYLLGDESQQVINTDPRFQLKAEFKGKDDAAPKWYSLESFADEVQTEKLFASHNVILRNFAIPYLKRFLNQ